MTRIEQLIVSAIKANGNRAITGDLLQEVLLEMVSSIGEEIGGVNVDNHHHTNKAVLDLFKMDSFGNVYLTESFFSEGSIASYRPGEGAGDMLPKVLWQNVEDRPTLLSQFINDIGAGGNPTTVTQRKYKTQATKPAKPTGDALDWDDVATPNGSTILVPVGANLYDAQYLVGQGAQYANQVATVNVQSRSVNYINPSLLKTNTQYRATLAMTSQSGVIRVVFNYSTGIPHTEYGQYSTNINYTSDPNRTLQSVRIEGEGNIIVYDGTKIQEVEASVGAGDPIWVIKRTTTNGVTSDWSDPIEWDGTTPVDPSDPPTGDIYWASIINRPTDLSQFANSPKYQTLSEVNTLIANAQLGGGTVNLDNYYTIPQADTLLLAKLNKNTYDTFIDKFNSMFALDASGNIKALKNLYSTGSIASYMGGASGQLLDEVLWQNVLGRPDMADYTTEQKVNQLIANAQLGGGGGEVDLTAYYLKTESDDKFALKTALANKANWDTAYGWGNHALANYALKTELHGHSNKLLLDKIDQNMAKASNAEFALVTANDFVVKEIVGGLPTAKSVKAFIDKFDLMFEFDTDNNIVAKTNFYSLGSVASYTSGTGARGLKLLDDMDAQLKSIHNVGNISAQSIAIATDITTLGLEADSITASLANFTEQISSPEVKIGVYAFKQDTSSRLGVFRNNIQIAHIATNGTYTKI